MNIAVDIDDTLTNSFEYFMPFVAEYFGADYEEQQTFILIHTRQLQKNWRMEKSYMIS